MLVVEDEPLIRFYVVELIESAGFPAVGAGDADEAIAILSVRKDIRVVFTDIDMPGSMDGLKLAAAIRNRWPPIEIILTSGNSKPPTANIPARGRYLPKPYRAEILLGAIRELAA